MVINHIIAGLMIIYKYDTEASVQAEHDQIFCGSYDLPLNDHDRELMNKMGWFEDVGCWSCWT